MNRRPIDSLSYKTGTINFKTLFKTLFDLKILTKCLSNSWGKKNIYINKFLCNRKIVGFFVFLAVSDLNFIYYRNSRILSWWRTFPNTQSEPPLMQLHAVSLGPLLVTRKRRSVDQRLTLPFLHEEVVGLLEASLL